MNAPANDAVPPPVESSSWTRRILLWILPLVIAVVSVYLYGSQGRYVSTDDAYLQQDRVDVAPQVSGNVVKVLVQENAHVDAGQPLIQLDDALLQVTLRTAEARLATARTEILGKKAAYREKRGELEVSRSAAVFARRERDRQAELLERKLISASAFDAVERSTQLSIGASGVIELQVAQSTAALAGQPEAAVDSYSSVRVALAEVQRARIDVANAIIRAPQAGIASHLPKVGMRVEVGRPACAIVADQRLWVEANFKETDLEWVRPGQPVEVDIDTYSQHRWSGTVESISQATGAAFSLLPAQNASGNWVKVVQRIPVRIAVKLNKDDPPLRYGMSTTVRIDTGPHTRFDRWFGRRATRSQ